MDALIVSLLLGLGAAGGPGASQQEPTTCLVDVLENGDLAQTAPGRDGRIPWWAVVAGTARVEALEGGVGLRTPPGTVVRQPLPAFEPLLSGAVLRVTVTGRGRLRLVDESGGEREWIVTPQVGETVPIELRGEDLFERERLVPRLELQLEGLAAEQGEPGAGALWSDLAFLAPLPCPSEDELRAEILDHLDAIFATWLERSLDDVGPRATTFWTRDFDAFTGEPIGEPRAAAHPLNLLFSEFLRRALPHADTDERRARWSAAYARYLDDFLALGLHPETGLPRSWNPVADVPLDGLPLQIARPLAFLVDVAEEGPEPFRARARAAALKIGEHVLARGLFPDGTVAPTWRPSDGAPFFDTPPLRRLDVPAALARLAALTGDARFADAAREACEEVEFLNFWPGRWDSIDPGFDDNYGHFGARAVTIWKALPGTPAGEAARRLALDGWRTYAPLWRDALRLGGNVAADQVRCWRIASDLAGLEPELAPGVAVLLELAVRSHFKGEQVENGAWVDVTVANFDPKANLSVGDTGGVPQNLLEGLGVVHGAGPGLATDELRARFTAVMRATVDAYGADFGLIGARRRADGANPAHGSLRFASGLVEMLEAL